MSCRSDSSSEVNSSCCYRSDVWSHLEYKVVSSGQIAILQITSSGRSLMYSRKSIEPRMDLLTRYYCEDFPSRNTRSCLMQRKDKIRPNYRPKIQWDLRLSRNRTCQTVLEALDILSATVRVVPDLLKALAILSDKTVRRSAVNRKEDLKPYWKSEKNAHISRWSTSLLSTSLSKTFYWP